MSNPRTCTVLQPGLMAYPAACALQQALVSTVRRDRDRAFLLLLEHPPVLTIGRRGSERNIVVPRSVLKREGIDVVETDRGGDITYHGPGQLVGYPIVALQGRGRDVHKYLRSLEALLIRTAAHFGIEAGRKQGFTGVWVGPRKLASIGVAFRAWTSFHGFALNVNPNMKHFALIHPCGLVGVQMTSLSQRAGRPVCVNDVMPILTAEFAAEFGFDRVAHGDVAEWQA